MVAILAILVGILTPTVRHAVALARRSACGANLRSIGTGYKEYATEYKGAYIPNGQITPQRVHEDPDDEYDNRDVLAKYVGQVEIFYCPGDYEGPPGQEPKHIEDDGDFWRCQETGGGYLANNPREISYALLLGYKPLPDGAMDYKDTVYDDPYDFPRVVDARGTDDVLAADWTCSWPNSGLGTANEPFAGNHGSHGEIEGANHLRGDISAHFEENCQARILESNTSLYIFW